MTQSPFTSSLGAGLVVDLQTSGGALFPVRLLAQPQDAAMWVLGNDFGFTLNGWTADIIGESYSGKPSIVIGTDELGVGVGHGLAVLSDGSLIMATSEDDGGNVNESFYWVPPRLVTQSGEMAEPAVIRMRCGDIDNPAAGTGARWAAQLGTGELVLGREYYALLATVGEARGLPDYRAAVVTTSTPSVLSSDVAVDASQRVWTCAGNVVQGVPRSALLAGGAQVPDKLMQGSNVSASTDPNAGAATLAFDATGGLWMFDYDSQTAKYWNAAAVGALTGVASNPAPTRTLTSPEVVDSWGINLDVFGGLWIADYFASDNRALRFDAAQIAAGGSQQPTRIVEGLPPFPIGIRFGAGYGAYLR